MATLDFTTKPLARFLELFEKLVITLAAIVLNTRFLKSLPVHVEGKLGLQIDENCTPYCSHLLELT